MACLKIIIVIVVFKMRNVSLNILGALENCWISKLPVAEISLRICCLAYAMVSSIKQEDNQNGNMWIGSRKFMFPSWTWITRACSRVGKPEDRLIYAEIGEYYSLERYYYHLNTNTDFYFKKTILYCKRHFGFTERTNRRVTFRFKQTEQISRKTNISSSRFSAC